MRFSGSITAIFGVLLFAVFGCVAEGGNLDRIEDELLAQDSRNEVVDFNLRQKGSQLIISVDGLNGGASKIDVFRVVAQSAAALKDKSFDEVVFAFRGTPKSKVSGVDYQVLGEEFTVQKPAYVLRTWPGKVMALDGSPLYEAHYGGLLYVYAEQMKDFSAWHEDWYLDELIAENDAKLEKLQPKKYADDEAF